MLAYTLGQKRLKEDAAAGLLHGVFLYGFLVLGLGHFEVILEGLTVLPPGLRGPALPLRAGAALVAERALPPEPGRAGRRRPRGRRPRPRAPVHGQPAAPAPALEGRRADPLVHRRPLRDVLRPRRRDRAPEAAGGGRPGPLPYQPFSSLAARAFSFLSTPAAEGLRAFGWWSHVLVFLGFAAYLPTTKHMHLVFAWPNIWLFRRQRYGLPPRIDFEATEKFGIDRVQELPWKSLLDSYACTECGRCNAVCPAHATGKPLMPMKVLHDVKVNLRDRNGADILTFRDSRGRPLPGRRRRRPPSSRRRPSSRSSRSTAAGWCARTGATCRSTARSTWTSCGRARPAPRACRPARS